MLLLKEMKQAQNLTEREQDICNYILEHPEQVAVLSSRELGHACGSRTTYHICS